MGKLHVTGKMGSPDAYDGSAGTQDIFPRSEPGKSLLLDLPF
jgi:hypothetical protein